MQAEPDNLEKDSLLDRWLRNENESERRIDIQPQPSGDVAPLSLGQERLQFLQQLYPENPFYNYADAYEFKGDLDLDCLIQSFKFVADRHEILRTNFRVQQGRTIQAVGENTGFEVSKHDLRNRQIKDRIEIAQAIAIEEARKPFDLIDGNLKRLTILQTSDDEYMVVLTMHHIIFDKWSMGILLREVSDLYKKLVDGDRIETAPLKIQYSDYAHWQSTQESKPENLEYWKTKLANSLEQLTLPTDLSRPNRPSFSGGYSTKVFDYSISKGLKALSRSNNTTLYTLLLTAYKVLLYRYTGESDILVGSPVTNRDRVELEPLIGFFNDTIVLRSDVSGNNTFTELLAQVKQTTAEAFAHKNTPFETLVRTLKPERFLNYNPLFQVMFIYHQVPKLSSFGKNLEISHKPFDFGVAKFDLTLYVSEKNDREISAIFEYSKDLFNEKTIHQMHQHFQNLLIGIIENPNQAISDLPLLGKNELRLLNEWNNTDSSDPRMKSILELFDAQVHSKPDSTAVSFGQKHLTYRELNEQVNNVANCLLNLNLDREKPIGLYIERSLEMIVGIFGILKAGFGYMPIDEISPLDRIDSILKDSGTLAVITQKNLADRIPASSIKSIFIEDIIAAGSSDGPILPEIALETDLAYVMYTSGSTGKPKGVSITHKNLAYSTNARSRFYKNAPLSFLLMSSFSFDSSIAGIFWTLTTGGKLVLTERGIEQDPDDLGRIFEREEITHTLLLPTLYSALLKNISSERFASLTTVIVAGETCPPSLCKQHFDKLQHVDLVNEYGPTEATVWATAYSFDRGDELRTIPIGKPISNTQIYILDENQNHVPTGVVGELFIGGGGIARGYFNDPKLTEKFFIANPFDSTDNDRLYKTGDSARFQPDGTIEFLGRNDDQVKIRGYRIELGDIQEAINKNPGVADSIVKVETPKTNLLSKDDPTTLFESLNAMTTSEADGFLQSVERLSDQEIEIILNKKETV